jgi:hypothetical protein
MPFGDSPILFGGPLYPSASRLCVRLTLFYLLVLLAARRQQVAVGGGGVAIRRRPAGSGGRRQGESGERESARKRKCRSGGYLTTCRPPERRQVPIGHWEADMCPDLPTSLVDGREALISPQVAYRPSNVRLELRLQFFPNKCYICNKSLKNIFFKKNSSAPKPTPPAV